MLVVGPNLYRVTYVMEHVPDKEFTRLVVAYSEKEAAAHLGYGVRSVSLVDKDVSLCVPDQYLGRRQ